MELRGALEREGHVAALQEGFLRELARVVRRVDGVDADDRQRDVVPDGDVALGGQQVRCHRREELARAARRCGHHVPHVDHRVDPVERAVADSMT